MKNPQWTPVSESGLTRDQIDDLGLYVRNVDQGSGEVPCVSTSNLKARVLRERETRRRSGETAEDHRTRALFEIAEVIGSIGSYLNDGPSISVSIDREDE